jgi:F1F0 ATPase subunit 2
MAPRRRKSVIIKIVELGVALLAGGGLGGFYFAGLWWTVRKLPTAQSPALLSLGSFLLRTAVVLAGFYLVMGDDWERLVACLLGFLAARVAMVRRMKPRRLDGSTVTARKHGGAF